ncbi:MAG: hypothetical protein GX542_13065, partial [Rhodococcus sp.]|nr:hypothetical protein [Rhodococcus sp. (in: high G+C Gram-positive bacteria)]
MSNPASALTAPVGADPIHDALEYFIGGSFISPAFYVQKFCTDVLSVDPWTWVTEKITGDWSLLGKAEESVKALSSFNSAYATSLTESLAKAESWSGGAEVAARDYVAQLSSAIRTQQAPLSEIAEQFKHFSMA